MTDNNHPITPPPALVEQWYDAIDNSSTSWKQELATHAARWGADMELEACCEWFSEDPPAVAQGLRAARRPNWPSLKEQALDELDRIQTHDESGQEIVNLSVIRHAIESLPD